MAACFSSANNFGVTAVAISFVLSLQALLFFADKILVFRKQDMVNWSAFTAALLGTLYTAWEAVYFLTGQMTHPSTCKVTMVWGVCRSASNILAFLHLLLRATKSNVLNPAWAWWRYIGALLMLTNCVLLLLVPTLRTVSILPGGGCTAEYEKVSFTLAWVVACVTHIIFTGMFIWPLVLHMRALQQARSSVPFSKQQQRWWSYLRGDDIYSHLVRKAVLSLFASTIWSIVVTLLVVLSFLGNVDLGVFVKALTGITVLDNAFLLTAISVANTWRLAKVPALPLHQQQQHYDARAAAAAAAAAALAQANSMKGMSSWSAPLRTSGPLTSSTVDQALSA